MAQLEQKTQPIEIIRGTSNTYNITPTDADGNPYTLAVGEKLLFGVKQSTADKEPLFVKVITSGTDGVYPVELEPGDTAELACGRFVYDVGLESGTKFFNIIKPSPFVIQPSVTKWGDGS